jgi:hypothetical protein
MAQGPACFGGREQWQSPGPTRTSEARCGRHHSRPAAAAENGGGGGVDSWWHRLVLLSC